MVRQWWALRFSLAAFGKSSWIETLGFFSWILDFQEITKKDEIQVLLDFLESVRIKMKQGVSNNRGIG